MKKESVPEEGMRTLADRNWGIETAAEHNTMARNGHCKPLLVRYD